MCHISLLNLASTIFVQKSIHSIVWFGYWTLNYINFSTVNVTTNSMIGISNHGKIYVVSIFLALYHTCISTIHYIPVRCGTLSNRAFGTFTASNHCCHANTLNGSNFQASDTVPHQLFHIFVNEIMPMTNHRCGVPIDSHRELLQI